MSLIGRRISRGFSASTVTIVTVPTNRLLLEAGTGALLLESGGYLIQG